MMKLQLETGLSGNLIESFIGNVLVIGSVQYTASLIISPDEVIHGWPPQHPDHLTIEDFGMILVHEPELILIGTGNDLQFPNSEIFKNVIRVGIGIDFMDSHAVCRTYNVLAAEGRRVVAGIIVEQFESTK